MAKSSKETLMNGIFKIKFRIQNPDDRESGGVQKDRNKFTTENRYNSIFYS
jgi:hypothetical protein